MKDFKQMKLTRTNPVTGKTDLALWVYAVILAFNVAILFTIY